MTAPTFKVGDRVRPNVPGEHRHGELAIICDVRSTSSGRQIADVQMVKDGHRIFYGLDELRDATPMSPEAKMVWHAMRAGAKRTAQYTSGSIALRVEIALPPRPYADDLPAVQP